VVLRLSDLPVSDRGRHRIRRFPVLDWTALILIVGLAIAFFRRTTDVGLLTTQRFGWDLLPLVLLFAIAATGLALTASSGRWEGRLYWFISLLHQATVVGWLLSIPFGKFFYIVQRPASIGVLLYQTVNQGRGALWRAATDWSVPSLCAAATLAAVRHRPQGNAERPGDGLRPRRRARSTPGLLPHV
jgi:hypothetical protein